jgi:hypothetical protein
MKRVATSAALPPVTHLVPTNPNPNSSPVNTATPPFGSPPLGVVLSVAKGSTLPGASAKRSHISCLSGLPVVEVAVKVLNKRGAEEDSKQRQYASYNEVLAWQHVLPFSPSFTGALLSLYTATEASSY